MEEKTVDDKNLREYATFRDRYLDVKHDLFFFNAKEITSIIFGYERRRIPLYGLRNFEKECQNLLSKVPELKLDEEEVMTWNDRLQHLHMGIMWEMKRANQHKKLSQRTTTPRIYSRIKSLKNYIWEYMRL